MTQTQQTLILDLGGVLLKEPERNLPSALPAHLIPANSNTRIFNRLFEFINLIQGNDEKRNWFLGITASDTLVALVLKHIDSPGYASFFNNETERQLIKHGAPHVLQAHHLNNLTYLDHEGLDFIKQCKAAGIRLCILSNWDPASFTMIVKKFPELFCLFEEQDIFIPTKTGAMKPDAACFAYVTSALRVDLNNCFFVDDSVMNSQAGERAGMHAVHHKNWHTTQEQLKQLGLKINP